MSRSKKLTRREFIVLAGAATGTAALAACSQPTPAPATQAPAPTQAAAPTTAPAPTAAAAPTAVAATAVPAPTAAPAKLGDTLIGKLEGPEIIRDLGMYPAKFTESPMWADMVGAGTLPALEERLPEASEVMVVKPLGEIGKYGGTWRRGFTGPADHENGNRIVSTDKILFWDYTGGKIMPALAKDWKLSDDGKTTTVYLRKGAKWSDGTPLTADDFMFWYDDIYMEQGTCADPVPEMLAGGQPGVMEKVDDFTVNFVFPEPNYLFPYILAGSTAIGAGFATRGAFGTYGGGYAPAHYLKQFLPKYSSVDEMNTKAKAAGFDDWKAYFKNRYSWALNTELPVMTPWVTVSPINTPTWGMERNPYYWAVDTEGNQLPYIDKITMTLAENLQVLNLRAVAGEYDIQERHIRLDNLPVLLDNQEKGDYTIHLDPALNGSDVTIHMGNAYTLDPEIGKWIRNKDFRHALSMGIDRDQLNETFWLGVGTSGSTAPAEETIYSPGPEWRTKWATLDLTRPTNCWTASAWTRKTARASGCARIMDSACDSK
jgi:peptide/nickel transport system substrate-binding protein